MNQFFQVDVRGRADIGAIFWKAKCMQTRTQMNGSRKNSTGLREGRLLFLHPLHIISARQIGMCTPIVLGECTDSVC